MADYPVRRYSKRQIEDAGRILRQIIAMPDDPSSIPLDVVEAFRIAHNWRMAHAYPMMRERIRLSTLASRIGGGVAVGRIKRMDSIRKKLVRGSTSLKEMQDLAGCRAVMDDMDGVRAVLAKYIPGRANRVSDYIIEPKADGYRSVHLIVKFDEAGIGVAFSGQTVEVQVRTRLQHCWATAVEAVGSMRGEDLKAGQGDARWLRLLQLMGAHLAEVEGQPLGVHGLQSGADRRQEIRALAGELQAVLNLSAYRDFLHLTGTPQVSGGSGIYFLQMDTESQQLSVVPRWRNIFDEAKDVNLSMNERRQSVYIGADSMDALRSAYPNYFLDVGVFLENLSDVLSGKSYVKFSATAAVPLQKSYIDKIDMGFLSNWRRPRR